MERKIRLMIIDDSAVYRNWLITQLSKDEHLEIIGYATDAFDARKKIPALKPDVLTLDIEMPGMSGLDFLKELLPRHPLPVILVSSLNIKVFDALAAGAVDFVRKPDMNSHMSKDAFLSMLISKLIVASQSKIRVPASQAAPVTSARRISGNVISQFKPESDNGTVIAIGASTGGTEAILEVLKQFPVNMPGIVITQHMPAGFTAMYAERLNRLCKLEVREARGGDRLRPGLALLAPGGQQMRLVRMGAGYAVQCSPGEKVNGHCPSVDVLFDSVAHTVREKAIGILLTGMGADGAAGLLRMRKNGAYTIGQDRETCVVYGMPMEAYKIGAVCVQSPLQSIPQAVVNRLSKS